MRDKLKAEQDLEALKEIHKTKKTGRSKVSQCFNPGLQPRIILFSLVHTAENRFDFLVKF